ncbi:MAG: 6-carboxytetrahydropterin synthase [Acidobacteria bacterium]|nr:6-carboxytetrahydropterin synthase [Acidobacteriota bacterium]
MSGWPRYRVVLAKEDFKFSAAHFTLWSGGGAELLHGHNYQVQLELSGSALDDVGLLVDIERCKRSLRALCARLDSRTLLPAGSERLVCVRRGETVEARLGDRCYAFPAADTLLLPLINTSIELLARMLWHDLAAELRGSRVEVLAVAVEEAAGQRCWYEDRVTPASPGPSS